MNFGNLFKRQPAKKIDWYDVEIPAKVPVSWFIKNVLSDRHTWGRMYIGNDVYEFKYGNLCDILQTSVLSLPITAVFVATLDTGETLYNVICD